MNTARAAEVEICEKFWQRVVRQTVAQVENLNYYTVWKQVGSRAADQTRTTPWLPVFNPSQPSIERLVRDQAVEEAS